MDQPNYSNTNEHLYDDIVMWEKTEGTCFFQEMPLNGNESPQVFDFGFGFGEYLLAAANAFPKGTILGLDRSPVAIKEVSNQIEVLGLSNIHLLHKDAQDLQEIESESMDLMLLYDTLHADYAMKHMLLTEAARILKPGGCLSTLPFHMSNWRDEMENKKKTTVKKVIDEITDYGFTYVGTCTQKGIHWEKCHTLYYIQKGNVTFDSLERMDVINFIKKL